ncbi:hypothetical protein MUP95_04020 [bacterium]|nr:hypothetical protein [bacterium]
MTIQNSSSNYTTIWPYTSFGLIAVAILVLALPARFEGPVLIVIGPGHALSVVDTVGALLLLIGSSWLHAGPWHRRKRLKTWVSKRPTVGASMIFVGGFGLGLLIAHRCFQVFFLVGNWSSRVYSSECAVGHCCKE